MSQVCTAAARVAASRAYAKFSERKLAQVSTYLMCQWASTNAAVTAWAARVVTNGGAAVSGATVSAVNTFYNGLVSNSLLSKMISVNVIAPDNLIAAITPLIVGGGNDPWTNNGFLPADITINGLQGSGTKYLNTGVNPSTAMPDNTQGGMTVYNRTSANQSWVEGGAHIGAGILAFAISYSDSNCYWDCFDGALGRIAVANGGWRGFLSCTRRSLTDSKVYRANGVTPFAQLGTSGTGGGARPNGNVYLFAQNLNGAPDSYAARQISFFAIHLGLTSAESQSLYNLVVSLRTAFGGGLWP